MHGDTPNRIRRHLTLPGGRQIEVIYLDNREESSYEPSTTTEPAAGASRQDPSVTSPPTARPPAASSETPVAAGPWLGDSPTAPGEALHVCPRCAGGLVTPLDWHEESPGRWRIHLRCPDCDLLREGVFGQALVERLDEELDRATAALLSDLRQLTHANMLEEIEVFSRALELDLIGPSDF